MTMIEWMSVADDAALGADACAPASPCGAISGVAHCANRGLAANVTKGCVETFDAAADYFPDKVNGRGRGNFSVEYHALLQGRDGQSDARRAVRRNATSSCSAARRAPRLTGALAGAQVVTVPITSLYSSSTTHLPLLVDLGRLDVLTGVVAGEGISPATRS